MSELKRRTDINKKIDSDKKYVDKIIKRAGDVVGDAGHISATDKKIELKGTEESAKEIMKGISSALENTKKTHEKLDLELDKKCGEIKDVEKDLTQRSDGMKKDVSSIQKELSAMKSKDTGQAKKEMIEAEKGAIDDSKYLKKSENLEKKLRITAQNEIKRQKGIINEFRVSTTKTNTSEEWKKIFEEKREIEIKKRESEFQQEEGLMKNSQFLYDKIKKDLHEKSIKAGKLLYEKNYRNKNDK